jgi:hypothetical protein
VAFQFLCGGKTGLLEDFLNATAHALDHAVGLRMAQRNQVPDLALSACLIERMLATGFLVCSEEAIRELRAIVEGIREAQPEDSQGGLSVACRGRNSAR